MRPKIISTLNNYKFLCDPKQTIEDLLNSSIDILRINFSKENEFDSVVCLIEKWLKNRKEFDLMLDFPLPGAKRRIYFDTSEKNIITLYPHCKYKLVCNTSNIKETLFVYGIDKFDIGERIIVGDGEGVLRITGKIEDGYIVKAEKTFELISGKSINKVFNNIDHIHFFKRCAQRIRPDAIILSFVEKKEQVLNVRKIMPAGLIIFSKIESQKGIENIEEIVKVSDGIMLGRGDLAIYSRINEFYYNQNVIIQTTQKYNKPIYIATDILESLSTRALPRRSEVVDLAVLLKAKVDGLVFSARIADFDRVRNFVRQIEL